MGLFRDYQQAVDFVAMGDQVEAARQHCIGFALMEAADLLDSAFAKTWNERQEAKALIEDTHAAILYDLKACEATFYRREREQQMTVSPYVADGRTRYVATVRDHEGEPIYWQDGFGDELQAWLYLFDAEDVPLPPNAASYMREAGIKRTEMPAFASTSGTDCPGCGNPLSGYGHAAHCPRFPTTTTEEPAK